MTNAQMIMDERLRLLKAGVIGTTGRALVMEDANGEEVKFPEPEEIHTYHGWIERGYQVQRGEKAITALTIWKYASKRKNNGSDEEGKEGNEGRMFLKRSYFFARSQVAEKPV